MKLIKLFLIYFAAIILAACGGGGGGTTNANNAGDNQPNPVAASEGINIGNISTIPTGNNATNTFVVVSNNFKDTLRLTDGTYTIYSTSGAITTHDINESSSPVNVTQCNTVQGNGSCSLQISVPVNSTPDGQYLISLNFKDDSTQTVYPVSQIISYSPNVPSSQTGVKFSTINNTLYNQPGSATTYSVPFTLDQTVNSLSAVSQYGNPAFAPTISCDGQSPYPAGTLCTLYIRISQTGTNSFISGNIFVSTSNGTNAQVSSKQISIKGQTGYLFNIPVTVLQSNLGNLVTSGINSIINPADGTSNPKTITLLNNGSGTISAISISAANPLTLVSNNCTSLAPNASCTAVINATQTTNGQAAVTVNYTTGTTNKVLTFNIAYIGAQATPGLSMFTSGNLTNTLINNAANILNITVKNTSTTTTLNSITFTAGASLPAGMSYESNNGGVGSTCALDGSQSLAPGIQCTLVLQYAPTVTVGSSTFTLRQSAIYSNLGSPASYSAANVTISYSAVTGSAFIYIKPSNVSFAIRAESNDLQTQTFTLVNASSVSTQVTSESNSSPPVTAYPGTVGGTCGSFPHTLGVPGSGSESCTITTQFGPTTATINTSSQMIAIYNAASGESASTYSFLTFVASPAALITVSNIAVTGQSSGNGNASPYLFTNSPTNAIQFVVTYRNSGTANATNFNVGLNNLPIGYYVVESLSTCGRESTTSTLNTASTCNVAFAAMSPIESYNPYAFAGAINVNIPGYSYTDTNTGLNTNSAPLFSPTYTSNTINVTAQTFGTATETTPPNWTNGTSGGSNTLTFTSATNGLRVTIPNSQQLTIFTLGGSGTCVIASGSCTISVTNPAGLPLQTYFFQYVVSPSGSSAGSAGIIQTGSFTYTQ